MQHSIAELRPGLFQLAEKRQQGGWRLAYFVKQAWGHCLCYNIIQIEPFLDFFKAQGGLAMHLLSDTEQFCASNARIFFKFGATTLVPPGEHGLCANTVARVLTYGSNEYFKANLKHITYDERVPKAMFSLTLNNKHILCLDNSFFGRNSKIVFLGADLPDSSLALRNLVREIKNCDYILLPNAENPDSGLIESPKDPVDILDLLAPNDKS